MVNNKSIKVIDKTKYILLKDNEVRNKSKMIFTGLDNIFAKVYNNVISSYYIILSLI